MNRDEQLTEWIRASAQDLLQRVGEQCRLAQPLTLRMTWDCEELAALSTAHDLDLDAEVAHALAVELKRELSDYLARMSAVSPSFAHLPTPTLALERPGEDSLVLTLLRQP